MPAQVGLNNVSDRDVRDEQGRQQEAGKYAGQPQLAHRLPGDHPIRNENHPGGDNDAQGAAGLDHAGGGITTHICKIKPRTGDQGYRGAKWERDLGRALGLAERGHCERGSMNGGWAHK